MHNTPSSTQTWENASFHVYALIITCTVNAASHSGLYYMHTLGSVTHSQTRTKRQLVRIGPLSLAEMPCFRFCEGILIGGAKQKRNRGSVRCQISLFHLVNKSEGSQCNDRY